MQVIERLRLIADEGKILTNGTIQGTVVDCAVEEKELWSEIDAPIEEEMEVEALKEKIAE